MSNPSGFCFDKHPGCVMHPDRHSLFQQFHAVSIGFIFATEKSIVVINEAK